MLQSCGCKKTRVFWGRQVANHMVDDKVRWYREPFVWMLIFIPLSAVVGGLITLGLAISSDDGLVVDDYYWRGKQINRVLERDRWAAAHEIKADLVLDYERRVVTARLAAREAIQLPARIRLALLHATRAGFDQTLELNRTLDGSYHALLPTLVPGHWYLQLESGDWRLLGSMRFPGDTEVHVTPATIP